VLEESLELELEEELLVSLEDDDCDVELSELEVYPSLEDVDEESIELELDDELVVIVLSEYSYEELLLESIELDELDELELNSLHARASVFGNGNKVPSQTTVPDKPLLFCSISVINPNPVLCPIAVKFVSVNSL